MKVSLAAARKNAGLTQVELAERVGVGFATVIAWEKGRKYPRVDQLERFCKACGCEVSDIYFAPKV